ncbi:MAG: 3-oxoacyl-[acyl-carrier-protein] reductase [Waddliaceae bacterium]|jgi:3-oxoacyl-[acyl-carrier protein] reductase|nr:3-oxoacyl-[acyl-carrier-protein] reductase [Waddliaceae bacterium]MBT3579123.1 3-oxoacyl-[acyl-carrier-protein] reductase [Waddliaceae bacterium]MBT4444916.1 3-oxoacyl-[acyl-carrier-protein] reductase [Waddliaceae bacterium]MBT6927931.1 3-oxoacyl-[acyl-carrier-protein] reductase [Waddliaceae bacterium]MBT7264797.1 3-oxoacyl-[acyl-carrier-protein] reductase [Waddliaceae bacterium]
MKVLENKTALITGGSSGIGKAIAKTFVDNGAKVIILDVNTEAGENTAKELGAAFYKVDVAKTKDVADTIANIIETHGTVDILVNNAGITRDSLIMRMDEDQWDSVIAVNLKAVYNTCKALARHMMKAKNGAIINIASVIGLTGNAGQANYAASKAGAIGVTKSLAKEFAAKNVRVNAIAPGFIRTAMTEKLTEQQKQAIQQKIPLGTFGEAEDVAKAALFLASEDSRYVTGQVLVVDGGMVM